MSSPSLLLILTGCLSLCLQSCTVNKLNVPKKDLPSPMVAEWKKQGDWLDKQQDGDFFLYVQRFDRAEESFEAAIEKAGLFGKQDARMARSLVGLARAQTARRKLPEAKENYEKALAIKRKSYGEAHSDIADILTELAYVKACSCESEAARDLVKQTDKALKKLQASRSAELQFIDAMIELNDGKDAETKLKTAADGFLAQIDLDKYPQPTKSMRTACDSVERLAIWYDSHGKPDQAEQYREKLQPIRQWLMIMGESV